MEVRAAAVSSLAAVLLVPGVLQAAAGSAGMANQVQEHWQVLSDALLDEAPEVVSGAVGAVTALLQAGLGAADADPPGFLLRRLAAITAARVSAALGPVLQMAGLVPVQAQSLVARLLLLLVGEAVRAGRWSSTVAGSEGVAGLQPSTLLPSAGMLAQAAVAHLSDLQQSADPAVQLEAAR